ncbi:MAG: alpha/beta hydrolase, partial [Cyclonatronaceae bacterium]
MKHEPRNTLQSGSSLKEAEKIIILIHGRGASAESILTLAQEFRPDETACYLAPAATGHAWYPYSFMAPRSQNEPWLSSALDMLDALVKQCLEAGKSAGQIVLAGFSQGACLATEFASRRAARYGGVIGFSGGLIGREIARENYSGDFKGTPVF